MKYVLSLAIAIILSLAITLTLNPRNFFADAAIQQYNVMHPVDWVFLEAGLTATIFIFLISFKRNKHVRP